MSNIKYMKAAMICLANAPYGQGLVAGVHRPYSKRSRTSSMKMYIDSITPFTPIDIPSLSESTPPAGMAIKSSNIASATSHLVDVLTPQVESEILSDASVALDVSTFFTPNTAWIRLFNVIGRFLILCSDYVQFDRVTPDAWVFHASMLAISTHMFSRSAMPLLSALLSTPTLTVRDKRSYILLCRAVGLTALQFRTMLASETLSWVQYNPNATVELNGEYMYFLYSGEAALLTGDDMASSISKSSSPRIFGDVQFANSLELFVSKNIKRKGKSTKSQKDTNSTTQHSSFVVGPRGANMLRISTSKLLRLMEDDHELSSSIQRLILHSMQEKLSSTTQRGDAVFQSTNSSSSTSNTTHSALA